jgi:hypothetical protein
LSTVGVTTLSTGAVTILSTVAVTTLSTGVVTIFDLVQQSGVVVNS